MREYSKDLLVQGKQFSIEAIHFKETFRMPMPHYHSHYELLYLPYGKRRLYVGEHVYDVSDRAIALIRPYVLHRSESATEGDSYRFLLDFTPELAESLQMFSCLPCLACLQSESPTIPLTHAQTEKIHMLFREIISLPAEDSFTPFRQKTLLCEILMLLSDRVQSGEHLSSVRERMTEVAQYIERHHKEKITLDSVAEAFFISTWYLSRTFKKYMGIGFSGYVNNLRILSAQKLLENPKCTVTQTALTSGFDNITHFERVFRRLTGITPKQYQKEIYSDPSLFRL